MLSLAEAARLHQYVRPKFSSSESAFVEVKEGRHPLLPEDACVGNDVSLGADGSNMVYLSGANFSGKSTYLKQVLFLFLLFCSGSRCVFLHFLRLPYFL